jgi:hypothetical protein
VGFDDWVRTWFVDLVLSWSIRREAGEVWEARDGLYAKVQGGGSGGFAADCFGGLRDRGGVGRVGASQGTCWFDAIEREAVAIGDAVSRALMARRAAHREAISLEAIFG